jgi:hypothetical protein
MSAYGLTLRFSSPLTGRRSDVTPISIVSPATKEGPFAMSETMEFSSSPPLRYTRRLIDHILIAFHHACDQSDFEVAQCLLQVVEFMARRPSTSPDGRERRGKHSLVAAHERLWHLRHPAKDRDDRDCYP